MRDETSVEPPEADCIPRDEPSSSTETDGAGANQHRQAEFCPIQCLTVLPTPGTRLLWGVWLFDCIPTGRVLPDSVSDGFAYPRHNAFCEVSGSSTAYRQAEFCPIRCLMVLPTPVTRLLWGVWLFACIPTGRVWPDSVPDGFAGWSLFVFWRKNLRKV